MISNNKANILIALSRYIYFEIQNECIVLHIGISLRNNINEC